jgi:hypothetical protein
MQAYLDRRDVKSLQFNKIKQCYEYRHHENGHLCTVGGLHRYLERLYYPHLAQAKHKWRGGGSSKATGIRVDRELVALAQRHRPQKPLHEFTQAIVDYFVSIGHRLRAAQVPVILDEIHRATQADVITVDGAGQLWMWEIKTGGTRMLHRAQGGNFAATSPLPLVPCTTAARYELQRYYTHQGLVNGGLPLHASRVLMVRKTKGKITCKELENAYWLPKL